MPRSSERNSDSKPAGSGRRTKSDRAGSTAASQPSAPERSAVKSENLGTTTDLSGPWSKSAQGP